VTGLECLERVSQNIGRIIINPSRAASPPVSNWGKLATIAQFAIDIAIITVKDCVVSKFGLAQFARGAFLVIALPLGYYFFVGKYSSSTSRTITLGIFILDGGRISGLQINIRWSVLRSIFIFVTHFTIDGPVWSIIVVQRVELVSTCGTSEAVFMIPFPVSSHHLLRLVHLSLALGATISTVFISFNDPGLHGGPGQHVVLVVVELGQVLSPRIQ